MTRYEEILEGCSKHVECMNNYSTREGFLLGANWADSNPCKTLRRSVKSTYSIGQTQEEIDNLAIYMLVKIQSKDWHAVADAAMDIRELEERIRILKEVE